MSERISPVLDREGHYNISLVRKRTESQFVDSVNLHRVAGLLHRHDSAIMAHLVN